MCCFLPDQWLPAVSQAVHCKAPLQVCMALWGRPDTAATDPEAYVRHAFYIKLENDRFICAGVVKTTISFGKARRVKFVQEHRIAVGRLGGVSGDGATLLPRQHWWNPCIRKRCTGQRS